MADLLLELLSEEIPAGMQARASADLKKRVTDGLVEAGLTYGGAESFVTPRRLVLAIEGLTATSPTVREERKGPRVDAPEKALEGFLRSTGLSKDQLVARSDKKGQVWFAVIEKPERTAAEIIAEVVPRVVRSFPWPKSMRWGTRSLRWVRPLQSILCVLSDEAGSEVVDFNIDGIEASNMTCGHRFMAPEWFSVEGFDDYERQLKQSFVVLSSDDRAAQIEADAQTLAFAQGMEMVADKGLLAEVAGLVEWPVVLMGEIATDFLDLPPEVLQTSMKEHQKFFSVKNPKSGRIERFVTVANRQTKDNGATILAGNQRVLFARLSDAKFFWENDLRAVADVGLEGMGAPLANVTFHNKLGSQADRVARTAGLAREIAPLVGADADMAETAAKVAKADLCSQMVGEFPELQGLMGRYYAAHAGLPDAVAAACQEHYSPLGPSDDVPNAPVSVAVALADKIDTLTGFWAIDEKPTGSKDPFALRRAALGVIRLVLENGARVELRKTFMFSLGLQIAQINWHRYIRVENELHEKGKKLGFTPAEIKEAAKRLGQQAQEKGMVISYMGMPDEPLRDELLEAVEVDTEVLTEDLLSFFHDRLKVYLRDKGISHDVIDACLAMPANDDFVLLVKRAEALQAFLKTDDGTNLLQGFKRANNILTAEEEKDGVEYSLDPEVKLAEDDSERALFGALDQAGKSITTAVEKEDFAGAMAALAGLRSPIDGFFEAVQVNAKSAIVRRNRLCLLNRIRAVMGQVAQFTVIER